MSEEHLEETLPHSTQGKAELPPPEKTQPTQIKSSANVEDTGPTAAPRKPKKRGRFWRWATGVVVGLIVFIGLGALGGYQAGIGQRQEAEALEMAKEAVIQFQYGESDLAAGNCDIARQRFDYVSQLNPDYPNLATKLAEAMLCSIGDSSSELTATEAPTPTPDLRGAEELFSAAQSLLADQNWTDLLTTIDTLRKNYPDFMPVESDGMYYIALRNRGYNRILNEGDLEGGIFDLNRAEKIGPLDADAQTLREAAKNYIIGQSFWEVDWAQAVQYFSYVAPIAPNLHDIDFFTAQDRLAQAKEAYVTELLDEASRLARGKEWCDAHDLVLEAETYSPISPEVQPTADWIFENCAADSGN